jgi:hypothetical protein
MQNAWQWHWPQPLATRCSRLALIFIMGQSSASPAGAVTQSQKSLYTSFSIKSCTVLRQHPDGNAYLCPGLSGVAVYFAEGDLRSFVSAGRDPALTKAAKQTLRAFNSPFSTKSKRATIEWRFVIKDKRPVPFAMIVRYFTQSDTGKGEVLVVTRLAGQDACHIAYVDALANTDAIILARKLADDRARADDCSKDPVVEGLTGKSPM